MQQYAAHILSKFPVRRKAEERERFTGYLSWELGERGYTPRIESGKMGTYSNVVVGDIEKAKQRENDFKNKEARRQNFRKRKWKTSKNNNSFIKIKDHLIVLYFNKKYNNWKYSLDNVFCPEVYISRDEAMDAAFEALEAVLGKV